MTERLSEREIIEPKLTWSGSETNGIGWEVCKWGKSYTGKPCWNTYLYIYDKEMVDALWSDNIRKYDWGTVIVPKDIIENLDWNGGQTYYHQIVDGEQRYIKVGDDYQHSWDEDRNYDEYILINRIKRISKELVEYMQGANNGRT